MYFGLDSGKQRIYVMWDVNFFFFSKKQLAVLVKCSYNVCSGISNYTVETLAVPYTYFFCVYCEL